MLPLLIFDAFYFHDEWGPNELSHTIPRVMTILVIEFSTVFVILRKIGH